MSRREKFAIAGVLSVLITVFVFDVMVVPAVTAGILYVLAILASWWCRGVNHILGAASIATVLVVVGYFLPRGDIDNFSALMNSGLTVFAVWVTAVIMYFNKATLQRSRDELDRRRRSEELLARRGKVLSKISSQFQSAFDGSGHGMALVSFTGNFLRVNEKFCAIVGYSEKELLKLDFKQFTHPDDLKVGEDARQQIIKGLSSSYSVEKRYIHKLGHEIHCQTSFSAVRNTNGEIVQFVAQVQDLTERDTLEDQLRQAQKMEAVGQLTGGLAHDFNNLLAIIHGNLSILEMDLDNGKEITEDRLRYAINESILAGKRGVNLISRLLTFSRQTELQSEEMSLNCIIEDMKDIFELTLGQAIRVDMQLESKNWLVDVDVAQLENTLLNLSINARDAMQGSGDLKISTREVVVSDEQALAHVGAKPGEYILLSVCDTGSGMDKETIERIFEPFFTTKELGKGTGLGLSMVYGFVKQTGGHILIESELGEGTTVNLYLPRIKELELGQQPTQEQA